MITVKWLEIFPFLAKQEWPEMVQYRINKTCLNILYSIFTIAF
jgi:hypothetical protein